MYAKHWNVKQLDNFKKGSNWKHETKRKKNQLDKIYKIKICNKKLLNSVVLWLI